MEYEDLIYLRCPNCGKYFVQKKDNKFCSEDCKIYYKSCEACGKYFISGRETDEIFCSNNCGINPNLHITLQDQKPVQDPQSLLADNL